MSSKHAFDLDNDLAFLKRVSIAINKDKIC